MLYESPPALRIVGQGAALAYRSSEAESVVDTIWVRNVGAGEAEVTIASAPWLETVPSPATVRSRATGWTPAADAVPIVVRKRSQLDGGEYIDTLAFSGNPRDVWNVGALSTLPVSVSFTRRPERVAR